MLLPQTSFGENVLGRLDRYPGRRRDRTGHHTHRAHLHHHTVLQAAVPVLEHHHRTRTPGNGTGTAAALQGIDVAGKTGTAEVDRSCGPNQLWFIAFAPAQDPRVAIAATVECGTGFGGTVAAPIAKAVMQELLK